MMSRAQLLTFFMVIVVAVRGRILDSQADPRDPHEEFFKKLPETEKQWMLRLAISHEGEVLGGGTKPAPIEEPPRIPDEVMERMLNGDISSQFQEKLIGWLRKDLGYTDGDFQKFQHDSSEFCSDGNTGCLSLRNIGGICCPFG